jgi:hypothetical protein
MSKEDLLLINELHLIELNFKCSLFSNRDGLRKYSKRKRWSSPHFRIQDKEM